MNWRNIFFFKKRADLVFQLLKKKSQLSRRSRVYDFCLNLIFSIRKNGTSTDFTLLCCGFSFSSYIFLLWQVKLLEIKLRGLVVFDIYFLTNKVYKKSCVGWIFLLHFFIFYKKNLYIREHLYVPASHTHNFFFLRYWIY